MAHAQVRRTKLSLPEENAFVVDARESIPEERSRVKTAGNRGNLSRRVGGRSSRGRRNASATTITGNGSGTGTSRRGNGRASGTSTSRTIPQKRTS